MLTENNLIWSKSYIRECIINAEREDLNVISLIENKNYIIHIKNKDFGFGDLNIFVNNLDKLKKKCILITSDGDRVVPSSYSKELCEKILNNSNIEKWYTQNYDKSIIHPKLTHYPIGFDLHTKRWLINNSISEKINFMVDCRNKSPVNKRITDKIFCDFHYSFTHPVRNKIYDVIKSNEMFELTETRKSFIDITMDYNKYNFVMSPRGNGIDCHRTWELFLAGVIVVTITSSLDDMYINNNLPVVIIQDIEELKNITKDTLSKWYNTNIDKTDINNIFPKLMYNYWIK